MGATRRPLRLGLSTSSTTSFVEATPGRRTTSVTRPGAEAERHRSARPRSSTSASATARRQVTIGGGGGGTGPGSNRPRAARSAVLSPWSRPGIATHAPPARPWTSVVPNGPGWTVSPPARSRCVRVRRITPRAWSTRRVVTASAWLRQRASRRTSQPAAPASHSSSHGTVTSPRTGTSTRGPNSGPGAPVALELPLPSVQRCSITVQPTCQVEPGRSVCQAASSSRAPTTNGNSPTIR